MKPFELQIELKSPIQIKRWLRLDGVLWHTLYAHYGDQMTAAKRLDDYLEATPGGYYKASTLSFATKGKAAKRGYKEAVIDNVLGVDRATVGVMRSGQDLSPEKFAPNSARGNRYTKLNLGSAPYKNRLTTHQCFHSDIVLFHGVGHGDDIADLIEFYIPALGVNANIGFGTIGSVRARNIETDYSCIDPRGKPTRPIPAEEYKLLSRAQAKTGPAILIPPFRNQPEVLCALPERIRKFTI